MIQSIIKIANELDGRGLVREADFADKLLIKLTLGTQKWTKEAESKAVAEIAATLASKIPWGEIVTDRRVIEFITNSGVRLIKSYLESLDIPDRSIATWASVIYHMHSRGALKGAFNRGFKDGMRTRYGNFPGAGEELTGSTSGEKIAIGAPSGIHAVAKKIVDSLEFFDEA